MDSSNFQNVLSLSSNQADAAKVFYLRSFDKNLADIDPSSGDYYKLEVPDPYNEAEESYKRVLVMIESAVDGFLAEIIQVHGA